MRKRARWVALGLAVLTGFSMLTVTTAGAQSSGSEKPKATDVGITDKEIHIAVIADVDTPLAPNIFKPVKDAVEGIGKYLNSKAGGGGLAGRKVVVDFYDSKLNANASTNAQISACENDVATVGTAASFITSVDNFRNCKDSTGAATGIPDIPFAPTLTAHQCSDQSFPMSPPLVLCSTKDQHPQTWRSNIARASYYNKKYGKGKLHGVYVFAGDTKAVYNTNFASTGGLREAGITSDLDVGLSSAAPQTAFTPAVQALKEKNATYAQANSTAQMVSFRKEAAVQGVTGVKVWDCTVSCYSKEFLTTGGKDVDGTYVSVPFVPFFDKKELKASPAAQNFVKYTGADNAASYGAYAWAAGIAFRDAVNSAVKAHGINGVTRKTIFEALNKMHKFDADGFIGEIDLAGREPSHCGVLVQEKNGGFVRARPTKAGTFYCDPKAIIERKLDLLNT